MKKKLLISTTLLLTFLLVFSLTGCSLNEASAKTQEPIPIKEVEQELIDIGEIPSYDGSPFVEINGNIPYFSEEELTNISFEAYDPLDSLGRCGVATASIGTDIMPAEDRSSISHIEPSGWQSITYENVDGKYLYNRSHLIGFQLTGENANEENLITGTRYMNAEGMLPFENMVADYVKETGNNVYYRVTPIFEGENLIATGVLMEGESVEDGGEGIQFNVFCYNVQPGIEIDYLTGNSKSLINSQESGGEANKEGSNSGVSKAKTSYVLNTNTDKYHKPSCYSVDDMNVENRKDVSDSEESIVSQGYEPCGNCKP